MKRGAPLKRSELVRKTPMNRGTTQLRRSEFRSSTPLKSGSGLPPVSRKRISANAQRQIVVSGMRLAQAGMCPRCGRTDLPIRGHERLARAHGGDIVHPDVLLDDICNGALEDAPRVSAWNGWKISAKWPHDPALQPWEARALNGVVVDLRAYAAAELEESA